MRDQSPTPAGPKTGRGPFLTLLIGLLATGCQRVEEITRYTVPKEPSTGAPHAAEHPAASSAPHVSTSGPQRMLASMLPEGEQVWFFKLVAPAAMVAEVADGFRSLMASVTLTGGSGGPSWTLPEGWRQKPASGMRFATIEVTTTKGPLELSVTPLRASGEFRAYALANVDRWRQQLGLDPTTMERLFGSSGQPGELTEVKGANGQTVLLVDLTGEGPGVETGMADSVTPSSPPVAGASATAAGPAASAGLEYETPPGWTPGKPDSLRRAAFEVSRDGQTAETTVITLPAGSGDLLSNVNRWRQQVGLEPLDATALPAQLKDVEVHGAKGQLVELVGPAGTQKQEAILGVICPVDQEVWYIKMKGDAALVAQERDAFQAFVRSVRFAGRDGANHGP